MMNKYMKMALGAKAQTDAVQRPFDIAARLASVDAIAPGAAADSSNNRGTALLEARHSVLRAVALPHSVLCKWIDDAVKSAAVATSSAASHAADSATTSDDTTGVAAVVAFLQEAAFLLTGTALGVQVDSIIMKLVAPFSTSSSSSADGSVPVPRTRLDEVLIAANTPDVALHSEAAAAAASTADPSSSCKGAVAVAGAALQRAFTNARARHGHHFLEGHNLFSTWRDVLEAMATDDNGAALDDALRASFRLQLRVPSASARAVVEAYTEFELDDAAAARLRRDVANVTDPPADMQLLTSQRSHAELAVCKAATPQAADAAWRRYAEIEAAAPPGASRFGAERALFVLMRGVADCEGRVAEVRGRQQRQQPPEDDEASSSSSAESVAAAWCDVGVTLLEELAFRSGGDDAAAAAFSSQMASQCGMASWIARHFELLSYLATAPRSSSSSSGVAGGGGAIAVSAAQRRANEADWAHRRLLMLDQCARLIGSALMAAARGGAAKGAAAVASINSAAALRDLNSRIASAAGVCGSDGTSSSSAGVPSSSASATSAALDQRIAIVELRLRNAEVIAMAAAAASGGVTATADAAAATAASPSAAAASHQAAAAALLDAASALCDSALRAALDEDDAAAAPGSDAAAALLPLLAQRTRASSSASPHSLPPLGDLGRAARRKLGAAESLLARGGHLAPQSYLGAQVALGDVAAQLLRFAAGGGHASSAELANLAQVIRSLWAHVDRAKARILLVVESLGGDAAGAPVGDADNHNIHASAEAGQRRQRSDGSDDLISSGAAAPKNRAVPPPPAAAASAPTVAVRRFFASKVPSDTTETELRNALLLAGVDVAAVKFLRPTRAGASASATVTVMLDVRTACEDGADAPASSSLPPGLVDLCRVFPGVSVAAEIAKGQFVPPPAARAAPAVNKSGASAPPAVAATEPRPQAVTNEDFAKLFG